jgi:hypothetical protein
MILSKIYYIKLQRTLKSLIEKPQKLIVNFLYLQQKKGFFLLENKK